MAERGGQGGEHLPGKARLVCVGIHTVYYGVYSGGSFLVDEIPLVVINKNGCSGFGVCWSREDW
jgi:hypothetical protein